MIAYVFLAIGAAGTAGILYTLAPAGRGLHRYAVPRSQLRAEAARHMAQAEDLACKLVGLAAELDASTGQRVNLATDLEKAGRRIADLEEQLAAFDSTCAENSRLRAELANARAIRPLHAGAVAADDASILPDELQQFIGDTSAWRAGT